MSGEDPKVSFEALLPRKPKRLAMVRLTPHVILDMMKMPAGGVTIGGSKVTCVQDQIPLSAQVYSAGVSPSGEIQIVMEDESFEPVGEGHTIKTISPMFAAKCAHAADERAGEREAATDSRPSMNSDGMFVQRVTLDITYDPRFWNEPSTWAWNAVLKDRTKTVRVVDADERHTCLRDLAAERDQVAALESAALVDHETIGRLTAERDAALRERDEAKEECERLRAERDAALLVLPACCGRLSDAAETVVQERDTARSRVAELLKDCETYGRAVLALQGQCDLANARVAELEAAANAVGGSKQEPVAWGVLMPNQDVRTVCLFSKTEEKAKENFPPSDGWTHFPIYAAPQPPRGWLTEEERKAVALAAEQAPESYFVSSSEGDWIRDVLSSLLARSTPPRVKMPPAAQGETPLVRDLMWGQAIRKAGGEVE